MRMWVARVAGWLAQRRGPGWVPAFYLGLTCVFYLPLVAGLASFEAGDFHDHFLPFAQFLQRELAAGRFPLWNPYTYAGHPFLADIQAGVYYLPSIPFALLGGMGGTDTRALVALQWDAVVHTALAGWGMHRLLGSLTGSRRGGLVAGVCFMLSGLVVGYAPLQLAILRSLVWIPWAMAFVWDAIHRPQRVGPWLGVTMAGALIILGGHGQTALYAAYLLAAWTLFALVHGYEHTQARRQALGAAVGMTLAGLLTVGLAAGQLWPTWEFVGLSVRTAVDSTVAGAGLPRQDTWQLLLPGVFSQFSPLYIGAAGLGLALFAVASAVWGRTGDFYVLPRRAGDSRVGQQNGRRVALFFGGVALFGLLAAYGDRIPLYGLLYRFAPGWDLFRGQERAALLVALSLAVLAGLGATWLPSAGRTLRKRTALILGGAFTVAVYGFGLLYQLLGATAIGDYFYLWVAFYTLAAGMAACVLLWVDGWGPGRTLVTVLLLAGNLIVANGFVNLAWGRPATHVAWTPELLALIETRNDSAGFEHEAQRVPARYYNEYRIGENYGMRVLLEDVWGASPLRLANYAPLFDTFPLDRMWALTGVEYVLTWRRELFVPSVVLAEIPQDEDTTYLHRLAAPMPRAWTVAQVVSLAQEDEILAQLGDHSVDLRRIAFLGPESGVQGEVLEGLAAADVLLYSHAPGHVALSVDVPDTSFVVISENWMPGWRVVGPGCEAWRACPPLEPVATEFPLPALQLVRTNLSFLGMVVPPGLTEVELVFRPDSVRLGAWISGVALLIWLGLCGVAWRRRGMGRGMV